MVRFTLFVILSTGLLWNVQELPDAYSSSRAELEIYPKHFLLHPGEQIHYTVCIEGSKPCCPDAEFAITDSKIVRMLTGNPPATAGIAKRSLACSSRY